MNCKIVRIREEDVPDVKQMLEKSSMKYFILQEQIEPNYSYLLFDLVNHTVTLGFTNYGYILCIAPLPQSLDEIKILFVTFCLSGKV